MGVAREAQGDHIVRQDIVVPPFHGQQAEMNRWLPGLCADASAAGCTLPLRERALMLSRHGEQTRFRHLLFFSGKMNFKWGKSYSLGVRAAVWRLACASGFSSADSSLVNAACAPT